MDTVMETGSAVNTMACTVAVTHPISKNRWEKWRRVDTKQHRISRSLKVGIQSSQSLRSDRRRGSSTSMTCKTGPWITWRRR